MAKKSILSEAQETIIEAAKTGVAVAELAATAGLAAAGPAAAGVVLDSVSKGLQRAEQKVTNVTPSEASETFGIMPKKTAMRTAKRKKQAVAKKRSSPKKKRATRKKKKTTAKNTAKTKRGRSRRKR